MLGMESGRLTCDAHLRIIHQPPLAHFAESSKIIPKPIFIHIDVCFKTIRGFTLAIRALLHIVIGFKVLGTIALFVFVWSIALGLNDASINNTDFASTNVKSLNAQLTVDFR